MPAFPFIIKQVELPKRVIVLQGRSLPHEGVAYGGDQRLDVTYNPGNPVAHVQVIGPTWKNTTITGEWNDIFLSDDANAGRLFNFPALRPVASAMATGLGLSGGDTFVSFATVPDQMARRARVLRDAFTLMRKEGGLVQVEWGSLVRFGFISSDIFPHKREEDIEFEIEFTWMGDTSSQPIFKFPKIELLALLKVLLALLDKIINTLLTVVANAQAWLTRITQFITKLGSFVSELLEVLGKLASFVFAPADVIGSIRGSLISIQLAARDLINDLDRGPAAAVLAALLGSPVFISIAMATEARLRRETMDLASEAALQEQALEEAGVADLLGVFPSPGGITLRDISTKFYGTPDSWTDIARFNGLSSSIVPRGVLVRIPAL